MHWLENTTIKCTQSIQVCYTFIERVLMYVTLHNNYYMYMYGLEPDNQLYSLQVSRHYDLVYWCEVLYCKC